MYPQQAFSLITVNADNTVTDLSANRSRSNLASSANSLDCGEIGISFTGQLVSTNTDLCFIPTEDDDTEDDENDA